MALESQIISDSSEEYINNLIWVQDLSYEEVIALTSNAKPPGNARPLFAVRPRCQVNARPTMWKIRIPTLTR